MENNNPIGVFDSGVGGTSIWKEIVDMLPNENTIYLADSKNAPYGQRDKQEIIALSVKNTEKLLQLNCKLIVVACNTATTNAIKILRKQFDVPFIGIEPAIKPAAIHTKTQKIGVLATKGTLSSELFEKTINLYASSTEIIEVIGSGIVELIEDGMIDSPEMETLLSSYLEPMIESDIDYLVLGCSHYPYLMPLLKRILPETVCVIDSGEAVAKQTKSILIKHQLLRTNTQIGSHTFFTNQNRSVLEKIINCNTKNIQLIASDF